MATVAKKKTKSIGQVAYLTKQVESLEKDLIRKDIEKLDTKIDNLETNLNTKIDSLDSKVESNFKWLKWIVGGGLTALLSIILYLHSDTKQDIKDLKQDMKELRQDINTKLDKLIERDLRK